MPFQIYRNPNQFAGVPEFGMGYHVVESNYRVAESDADVYILFSHEFVLPIGEVLSVDPGLAASAPIDIETWVRNNSPTFPADLNPCRPGVFGSHPILRPFTSSPAGGVSAPPSGPATPPAPPAAPVPYGHLPFLRATLTDSERFVRYTTFRTDRRVDPAAGALRDGTFAAPASEERMVPSGFSAVGRFALPSLLPAIWRRDIVPPAGTAYLCGAVVPMYGQAGGGVEVKFDWGAPAGSAHLRVASIPEL
jgi:hypothetical protein